MEARLRNAAWPLAAPELLEAKKLGFSDAAIARLMKQPEATVRALRTGHGLRPHIAQIDTLAAEFPAQTNYLYSSYHASALSLIHI